VRRWALLLFGLLGCGGPTPTAVEPPLTVDAQPVQIELVRAQPVSPVSTPVEAPTPELPEWNDLSTRVVWVWVTDREAKQLRSATSLLVSAMPERAPYSLRLAASVRERLRAADELTPLERSPSFARRQTAAPNLMGAVLLRKEDAFVPVRVTLEPGSLVVDLEARTTRTLEGDPVPLDEVRGRANQIALFAVRSGAMRGYQLVRADRVTRLEIGTPEVLAAFDREITLLEAFAQELETFNPVEVPLALERLRRAAVEPRAGWDATERLAALRTLRAHATFSWSWERGADAKPFVLAAGEIGGTANPCRKLFKPGRMLEPGEWCGTGALSYHYCSEGCSMVEAACLPDASRFE
jgi:hypothetical protein